MNNYLNFEEGEISIYLAGDALVNLQCSLEQAEAIRRDSRRGAVLYVNTSFTARKFRSSWREIIGTQDRGLDSRIRGNDKSNCHSHENGNPEGRLALDSRIPGNDKEGRGNDREGMDSPVRGNGSAERIFSLDCPIGELLWEFNKMKGMVRKHNIRQIVINNWEYGFKDYRQKEEAIFRLHEFLNAGVSLLIYAQTNPEKTKPGKIMHGGLGKLTGISAAVINLAKEKAKEENQEEVREFPTENVNLVGNKINDLPYPHEDLAEEGLLVTSAGIVSSNGKAKHLPMSNKNRRLLAEYEKLYGKAQEPGESFRDMFDRVVGKMIAEKEEVREMAVA